MKLSWNQQKEQNRIDSEKHAAGRVCTGRDLKGRKFKTERLATKLARKHARRAAKRAAA